MIAADTPNRPPDRHPLEPQITGVITSRKVASESEYDGQLRQRDEKTETLSTQPCLHIIHTQPKETQHCEQRTVPTGGRDQFQMVFSITAILTAPGDSLPRPLPWPGGRGLTLIFRWRLEFAGDNDGDPAFPSSSSSSPPSPPSSSSSSCSKPCCAGGRETGHSSSQSRGN